MVKPLRQASDCGCSGVVVTQLKAVSPLPALNQKKSLVVHARQWLHHAALSMVPSEALKAEKMHHGGDNEAGAQQTGTSFKESDAPSLK